MSRWKAILLIARKDLLIERRGRVALFQVVPFAGLVLVIFAFALDAKAVRFEDTAAGSRSVSLLPLVAPGLIWLAVLFSVLLIVQRSFAIESEDGAADALRLAGVEQSSVFWGKSLAVAVELLLLEAVVVVLALVLYGVSVPWSRLVLLVPTVLLATAALAVVATLYGGLTLGVGGGSGRESLLPLLAIPALAPVIIAATRATESAFATDGLAMEEGWPWVGLLAVYTVALAVVGALAFGPLSE